MLRQYEFHDKKADEIGIFDRLTWSAIAKMMQL